MSNSLYGAAPRVLEGLNWPEAPAEELALLETCVNLPEDRAPRLIYADWLQENGLALVADFIRTQCDHKSYRRIGIPARLIYEASALAYWRPKFVHSELDCNLSINNDQFTPAIPRKGKAYAYGRSFVLGLPTRVVVGVGCLIKLFFECSEKQVLSLVTELEVPREDPASNLGQWGNLDHYRKGYEWAKDLKPLLAKSPYLSSSAKVTLFGIG